MFVFSAHGPKQHKRRDSSALTAFAAALGGNIVTMPASEKPDLTVSDVKGA